MINRQRLVDTFLMLANINSPTYNELEIANLLEKELPKLGFEVEVDDTAEKTGSNTGNLIAKKQGSIANALPIMFSVHMDTVASTEGLEYKIDENDVIHSVGNTILGADDKAGIAAIMECMKALQENSIPHGNIEIVFSVAEESGLHGARHLDISKIESKCCFVYDIGSPVGSIAVAAPTHDNIKATVKGKAAHAGANPENGINAIYAASKAIASMNLGKIDEETTANIGIINAGTATNIVPDLCIIQGEARSRNSSKLDAQIQHMKDAFQKAAEETGASIDVDVVRSYVGYRIKDSDPAFQIAVEAAKRAGINLHIQETGGGSDANVYNLKGISSIPIGIGYENPHSSKETVAIDDLVLSAKMAVEIVKIASEISD